MYQEGASRKDDDITLKQIAQHGRSSGAKEKCDLGFEVKQLGAIVSLPFNWAVWALFPSLCCSQGAQARGTEAHIFEVFL